LVLAPRGPPHSRGGHEPIAIDLPGDDRHAGLAAYADNRRPRHRGTKDVILVAQSLAGFTTPLACARADDRVRQRDDPKARRGRWCMVGRNWSDRSTGTSCGAGRLCDGLRSRNLLSARRATHDVLRAGPEQPREEAEIAFSESCRFERWLDIPIHVLAGRDDRFFPIELQRRIARERLRREVIPGGHLVAFSNSEGLTERLLTCEGRNREKSSRD
jgi:pimeloyl-ACP methyl ester carboxylesterase